MHEKTILVFTALGVETKAVERALAGIRRAVAVHTIGISANRVPSVVPKNVGVIILAGIGSALEPALKIGDVVLDDPKGIGPADLTIRRGKICMSVIILRTP